MNKHTEHRLGDLVQVDMLDPYGRVQPVEGVIFARFPHGDHDRVQRLKIRLGNGSTVCLTPDRIVNSLSR